jgi:GT2 family glycosyltransferase
LLQPDPSPVAQTFWLSQTANQYSKDRDLPFSDVCSNNMCLSREAYFRIGMMQTLDFTGSSLWCDVEFSYRAFRQGFRFRRSTTAICWHRDHTARSLDHYRQRMRVAAYRAVVLFQKHPELLAQLPMFADKTPIDWDNDPPHLIVRKMARTLLSSRPALWGMEQAVTFLERRLPTSTLLSALCRYSVGGHIFQGYREGLGRFGRVRQL